MAADDEGFDIVDPLLGTGGFLQAATTRVYAALTADAEVLPPYRTDASRAEAQLEAVMMDHILGVLIDEVAEEYLPRNWDRSEGLAEDAALFAALVAEGFAGPAWERFAVTLFDYGAGVLDAWMGSGELFEQFKSKGVRFTPSPQEIDRILYNAEFRDELVNTAVGEALLTFRRRALDGTGWRAEGGAALTTYFVVACLHATTNELNKQRRANERARKSDEAALRREINRSSHDRHVPDPSQQAIDNLILQHYLAQLSARDRNIVWGKACGCSNREIAEIYGELSPRAVEQRWSTLTKTVDWIGRLAGKESK